MHEIITQYIKRKKKTIFIQRSSDILWHCGAPQGATILVEKDTSLEGIILNFYKVIPNICKFDFGPKTNNKC